jgi:hypothetical protein
LSEGVAGEYDAGKEIPMIELTDEQRRLLDEAGWPPRAMNPATKQTFVLLPEEMFERVRALLEEEDEIASVEEMGPLVNEALEADEASSRESA